MILLQKVIAKVGQFCMALDDRDFSVLPQVNLLDRKKLFQPEINY